MHAISHFPAGIICGSGSFAVQFGDHFRSGDHLRSGIICGAVQYRETRKKSSKYAGMIYEGSPSEIIRRVIK